MTRSTEILLRPLFARFAIVIASGLFSLVLGLGGMTPLIAALVVGVLVALTILIVDWQLVIGRYVFPATPHQITWIPRLTFILAMGISCILFLPGLLVTAELSFWNVVGSWTFVTLLILMGARFMTRWPHSIGMWPVLLLNLGRRPEDTGFQALQLIAPFSPVWLAGVLFFMLEAPKFEAMIRRLDYKSEKYSYTVEAGGPAKPTVMTRLADFFSIVLGLAIFLPPLLQDRLGYAVVAGMVAVFSYFLLRGNRASGMSWSRALATLILELTMIGYLFKDKLGVLHGGAVKCSTCNKLKMAWVQQCPHCESLQENVRGDLVQTAAATDFLETAIGPTFFRVLVPVGLVIWITVSNWNSWVS